MTDRDQELDSILEPLRTSEPTELELKSWQQKINAELKILHRQKAKQSQRRFFELFAALILGFIFGAFVYDSYKSRKQQSNSGVASDFYENAATIQHIYTNID